MRKTLFLFLLVVSIIQAQKVQTFTSNKPSSFMSEVGAMVVLDNKKVILDMVMPKESRGEEYKSVDLQKGDEILYLNGSKVNNLEEFKKLYDRIKKGSEVKLGVARKENKFFVTFKRGDAANMTRRIVTIGPDGKAKDGSGSEIKDGKIKVNGKTINVDSLKKTGKIKIITK